MTTEVCKGEVIDGRNDVMLSDCSRLRTLSAPGVKLLIPRNIGELMELIDGQTAKTIDTGCVSFDWTVPCCVAVLFAR
jgi:hypothetical protein